MIVAAAVVPHPPLLLPGVTGGPVPEVDRLRLACSAAVAWASGSADSVVVVGGADRTRTWPNLEPMRAGFVGDAETGDRLPLSLSAVRTLLAEGVRAEWRSIAVSAPAAEAVALGRQLAAGPRATALVVAGDGSARRGPKAPGYEDERARPFDAAVTAALAAADVASLADLDPVLADELLVHGRAAWQVMAAACAGGAWTAEVDYADDPFGVYYLVARWSRR